MKIAPGSKIVSFFIHPVVISFILTVLIVVLFIPYPYKYRLLLKDQLSAPATLLILNDDLDGNGYSDRIMASEYAQSNGIASVLIRCHPFIAFNEWDVTGSFSMNSTSFLTTGDYDHNHLKEVYFFYFRNDSLFLNIIIDPTSKSSKVVCRFICTLVPWNGKPQFNIHGFSVADMNLDSYGDLVFAVNAGFSLKPRKVFIYDIKNDTLLSSPEKGFMGTVSLVRDINKDGFPEIILNGYATQNMDDTNAIPYHDKCCWLIAYDHSLNYLFPPVKFPAIGYSGITNALVPRKNGRFGLFTHYTPPEASRKLSRIYHLDDHGRFLNSVTVNEGGFARGGAIFALKKRNKFHLAVPVTDDQLFCYDTSLNFVKEKNFRAGMAIIQDSIDIDMDGKRELISLSGSRNRFTIYRDDLSHPATLYLPDKQLGDTRISVIREPGTPLVVELFSREREFLLSYSLNPLFYFQWLIYLSIFISILLFIILIKKIQLIRINAKLRNEKKITELQLTIIRNQMDPHFTMNAINSVIDAVSNKEPEEAVDNLLHFSKMYRSLVLSGDKISRTLREELEFTENYLALEKFRFRDRFEFTIQIDPQIDTSIEIPKMIVQAAVENAVKHGLSSLESGGKVDIKASVEDSEIHLMIQDNGIGREKAALETNGSTGKGTQIMDQFLDLYHNITGLKIRSFVEDLHDSEGKSMGTKVLITVPLVQK